MTSAVQTGAAGGRSRWRDLAAYAVGFLVLMALYEWLRDLVALDEPALPAYEHAEQIIDAERGMGLLIEDDLQQAVHAIPGGRFVTTWFYTLAYVTGYIAFFAWVFFFRRAHMALMFTWYWITNGLAVIGYWLYPLAPPRFIEGLGLEDTTKAAVELGGTLEWFQPFRNLYAAMPSMHVGQTILYALAITWLVRSPWRWLAWLWPGMMLLTVMVTANHFWLDGVGGAIAVGLALPLAMWVVRAPAPWRAGRNEVSAV